MNDIRLILASSSPRRQELIRLLGLPVDVLPSDADETVEDGWTPSEVVERLSLRKAEAVRHRLEGRSGVIVGSDTIVTLDGQVLGKPQDEEDAAAMLRALSGREHQVYSGVALIDAASGRSAVGHAATRVWMKRLDEERIRRYIATGEPRDKAGAYGIQGAGTLLVERIEGDFYNVVGLPVARVADMLEASFGIRVL
ncbi:Maf family protein [Paenibacillus sp. TRM 82003]|nr:Maf family protein [Paenibacillus sp. TRM 82003]